MSLDPATLPADVLADLSFDDRRSRIDAVRRGLSISGVLRLLDTGRLTPDEVGTTILPLAALSERARSGRGLTPPESDRFVRVVRVVAAAERTFGSVRRAADWLRRPTEALDGDTPMALLDTSEGTRDVEILLGRIDHGIGA